MSLDWHVREVQDFETVCFTTATEDRPMSGIKAGDRHLKAETEVLVFATMWLGTGMGVTAANVDEVVVRVDLYQRLFGPLMHAFDSETGEAEPHPLSEEVIRAHVGLFTNTFGHEETRNQWVVRMTEQKYGKSSFKKPRR